MARYDTLRKLGRNKALIQYARDNPDLSYKEVGEGFGISESRAWRIINRKKGKNENSNCD